ncbi:LysM peptidoglycan-binding domain-containing protein [Leucobacter sp. UCMA 4100]|uniref:LysM peptidoglycan-binding domain-containing protein n=1 Tax=Leucobacter sp. UCMA 4100 TaxID=2810534 RepID=UPI0022EB86C5|nr:LysM peptidoglycan-binding domain-containing protein [Leucobacter sp. UCMA 4100]MDA3147919.1 LysM peptidoglycan-binding domain-containing protein [Leucobacter sp. UCMA 4100]
MNATVYATASHIETQAIAQRTTLRLTRRGRLVFSTLAASVVVAGIALGALFFPSSAQASIENTDPVAFEYIVAEPGDSLWSLAQRIAPGVDTRDVVYDLKRLNQLEGSDIVVGQEIAVPLNYTE